MLDFEAMKTETVDDDIKDFINRYGGNHVALLRAWELFTDMRDDTEAVRQQLCYSLGRGRNEVCKRLLGRYKVLRNEEEVLALDKILGIPPLDVLS